MSVQLVRSRWDEPACDSRKRSHLRCPSKHAESTSRFLLGLVTASIDRTNNITIGARARPRQDTDAGASYRREQDLTTRNYSAPNFRKACTQRKGACVDVVIMQMSSPYPKPDLRRRQETRHARGTALSQYMLYRTQSSVPTSRLCALVFVRSATRRRRLLSCRIRLRTRSILQ